MEKKIAITVGGKESELQLYGPGTDRFGNACDERIQSGSSIIYIYTPRITQEENLKRIASIYAGAASILQNAIERGTFLFNHSDDVS